MMTDETAINPFARGVWGLLGGIVAVGSKYIAQDHYWVRILIDTRQFDQIPGIVFFYIGLLIVLGGIGAVFAVASQENHRMKILAIAVSAPALVTTWLGGASADTRTPRLSEVLGISLAHAADDQDKPRSGFWDGFLLGAGIGKDDSRYRVIAGSYANPTQAALVADRIRKENPTLQVFVGEPKSNNSFSAVVVGGYLPYPEARKLKDEVSKLDAVKDKDVFLSPFK